MKSLKEKIGANELTVGSWITLGHTAIAEIMAAKIIKVSPMMPPNLVNFNF